jgi:acyl dehydratase
VHTVDQHGREILDFHRCAMLPMRDESRRPGHADDLEAIPAELDDGALARCVAGWDLDAYRELVPGAGAGTPAPETVFKIEAGDTVTAAPELARLTLNVAAAHLDPAAAGRGRRLVYGGHTIGIALSHVTRALPDLVTIVAWRSCDHLAPVYEGDVLHTAVTVTSVAPIAGGATLVDLRVQTAGARGDGTALGAVLDWRPVAVLA